MIISQRQSQLRHRGRMNLLVMLLMLFVVSGHCSAAMMLAPQMADNVERIATPALSHPVSHCGEIGADVEGSQAGANSPNGVDCWDDNCTSSLTSLQSPASSQSKDNQPDYQLLLMADYDLPLTRDGPCRVQPRSVSAEFVSPPLFYSLCVLRL